MFIYPVWWYGRPALLKGWIDRVLPPGFAYRYERSGVNGLLAGKRAVVLQTTGAPREAYAANDEEDAIVNQRPRPRHPPTHPAIERRRARGDRGAHCSSEAERGSRRNVLQDMFSMTS